MNGGHVWAVCSEGIAWPYEVWALYGSAKEARRHSDSSPWRFVKKRLPVYASYDNCPPVDRLTRPVDGAEWRREHQQAGVETQDERPLYGLTRVYAACTEDSDLSGRVEAYVLYADSTEAERQVAGAYCAMAVVELPVYPTYDVCPPPAPVWRRQRSPAVPAGEPAGVCA